MTPMHACEIARAKPRMIKTQCGARVRLHLRRIWDSANERRRARRTAERGGCREVRGSEGRSQRRCRGDGAARGIRKAEPASPRPPPRESTPRSDRSPCGNSRRCWRPARSDSTRRVGRILANRTSRARAKPRRGRVGRDEIDAWLQYRPIGRAHQGCFFRHDRRATGSR